MKAADTPTQTATHARPGAAAGDTSDKDLDTHPTQKAWIWTRTDGFVVHVVRDVDVARRALDEVVQPVRVHPQEHLWEKREAKRRKEHGERGKSIGSGGPERRSTNRSTNTGVQRERGKHRGGKPSSRHSAQGHENEAKSETQS
jgi:hypothetical protein